MVWVVRTTRSLQTGINGFIANLAVSDITLSLFCTPFQFYAAFKQRWDLPVFMCKFCPFAQSCSVNVSVFTLIAISCDRYAAIMNPMGHKSTSMHKAKGVVGGIWLASIVFALPTAYFHKFGYINDANDFITGTRPFCSLNTHNVFPHKFVNGTINKIDFEDDPFEFLKNPSKVYHMLVIFFQFAVPYAIMVYQYFQMAYKLCTTQTPGNPQGDRDSVIRKNKSKSVIMMITVIVLFAICWLPWHIYHFSNTITSVSSFLK